MTRFGSLLAVLLTLCSSEARAQTCSPPIDFSAFLDFAPPLRRTEGASGAHVAAAPLATSRSVAPSFQISANGPTFTRGSIDTETVMRLVAERLDRVGREAMRDALRELGGESLVVEDAVTTLAGLVGSASGTPGAGRTVTNLILRVGLTFLTAAVMASPLLDACPSDAPAEGSLCGALGADTVVCQQDDAFFRLSPAQRLLLLDVVYDGLAASPLPALQDLGFQTVPLERRSRGASKLAALYARRPALRRWVRRQVGGAFGLLSAIANVPNRPSEILQLLLQCGNGSTAPECRVLELESLFAQIGGVETAARPLREHSLECRNAPGVLVDALADLDESLARVGDIPTDERAKSLFGLSLDHVGNVLDLFDAVDRVRSALPRCDPAAADGGQRIAAFVTAVGGGAAGVWGRVRDRRERRALEEIRLTVERVTSGRPDFPHSLEGMRSHFSALFGSFAEDASGRSDLPDLLRILGGAWDDDPAAHLVRALDIISRARIPETLGDTPARPVLTALLGSVARRTASADGQLAVDVPGLVLGLADEPSLGGDQGLFLHLTIGSGYLLDATRNVHAPLISEQIGFGYRWNLDRRFVLKTGLYGSGILYRSVFDHEESNAVYFGPFLALDLYGAIEAWASFPLVAVDPPTNEEPAEAHLAFSAGFQLPLADYLTALTTDD